MVVTLASAFIHRFLLKLVCLWLTTLSLPIHLALSLKTPSSWSLKVRVRVGLIYVCTACTPSIVLITSSETLLSKGKYHALCQTPFGGCHRKGLEIANEQDVCPLLCSCCLWEHGSLFEIWPSSAPNPQPHVHDEAGGEPVGLLCSLGSFLCHFHMGLLHWLLPGEIKPSGPWPRVGKTYTEVQA